MACSTAAIAFIGPRVEARCRYFAEKYVFLDFDRAWFNAAVPRALQQLPGGQKRLHQPLDPFRQRGDVPGVDVDPVQETVGS
jgi:hypothetical protein